MDIIFMGTPDFAVPSLNTLADSDHRLIAVVTAPDKPRGRGRKPLPSPVKKRALELNLPLLQPQKLKDPVFIQKIKVLRPDIFVVVAFRILPRELYAIPPYGAVNAHASLLPKYRGAAPIHHAILRGETETGISTFQIEDKVDTGGILIQKKIHIDPEETTGTLSDKLKVLAAECLVDTLDGLERGTLKPFPQDNTKATPAPKIHPEDAILDFSLPGEHIINTIRAFSPVPGARFFLRDRMIKILRGHFQPQTDTHPGKIERSGKDAFVIHCADGLIFPEELQMEGKRKMSVRNFINGFDVNLYGRVDDLS